MAQMSGARALVEALEKEGTTVAFGMPGGANLPIYDELYNSKIRHILVRHEQSAAHMADGYGRVTRRPGVCMATSGPGATNLVTGIATAYMDSSPIVAVTGQVPSVMIGRDAFQETDIVGIAASITKWTVQPRKPSDIPLAIKKAFYISATGRPGPVLVDIPKDAQNEVEDIGFSDKVDLSRYNPYPPVDPARVEEAAMLLVNAERPMIMSGGGINISGASTELQGVAQLLMSPVVTTLQGKGSFPENHPLSLGPIGMHGRAEANKLVQECDVLLVAGARFSDRSTGKFDEFVPEAKVIHIDVDPSEIGKNKQVDVYLVGDAKEILRNLFAAIEKRRRTAPTFQWLGRMTQVSEELQNISAYQDNGSDLYGPRIVKKMREILPPKAILTTGVGRHQMWCEVHYRVLAPRTWITSTGLGTMGFGLPAAIGAKVAKPDVPVVDFDGDGSFAMTENCLATAVEDHIPVTAIILNDRTLGMVEQWQRVFYGRRYIGVKQGRVPDFVKVAEAYGAEGMRIDSLETFDRSLRTALKSDVPTVIEIPVLPDEDVYPFMPPGMSLKDTIHGKKETAVF